MNSSQSEILKNLKNLAKKERDDDGWTPLVEASLDGHLDIVKELIKAGADVNASVNDERTALSIASDEGCLDIIEELIKAGAKVESIE